MADKEYTFEVKISLKNLFFLKDIDDFKLEEDELKEYYVKAVEESTEDNYYFNDDIQYELFSMILNPYMNKEQPDNKYLYELSQRNILKTVFYESPLFYSEKIDL